MFKSTRWRSEKNKIKVVFKLQFKATQVPEMGCETMMVTLVPVDAGKPTLRSEKAPVIAGECSWPNPVYETVKLTQDPKTGKHNDKAYQFLVSATGRTRSELVGEITVNLADYVQVLKPTSVSLPLKASSGAFLHVTLQRMQGDVEGRDADYGNGDVTIRQQRRTLQSQLSNCDEDEGRRDSNGLNGINSAEVQRPGDFNGSLRKSSSLDGMSASGSETSSGQFTPKENGIKSNTDWGGSTNSSGETGPRERSQESDVASLRRRIEVSDLEVQTLRKQVVKENRRGLELLRELGSIKEERDGFKRECEELKALRRGEIGDGDPRSVLEEIKQELDLEKNLNANLRVQLQKTQEANTELILAVRDLEELLEQNNSEPKEELLVASSEKEWCELEQKIMDLNNTVELYRRDREDIEMQMEQLALDYEIIKQENHDMASKLEQIKLREQLRMQYECSAHLAAISDLEDQVERMENELHEQGETFEADLEAITNARVEQEQRAIRAEEALMKMRLNNANTAEHIQEGLKTLCVEMSSMFYENENLLKQALAEKSQLEELLERTNEELLSVKGQCCVKIQQLLSLADLKTKETERLFQELKDKQEELDNQKKSEKERQRASYQEMALLRAEMDKHSRQIEHTEKLEAEMEEMAVVVKESEILLQEREMERSMLQIELASLRVEANKSMKGNLFNMRHGNMPGDEQVIASKLQKKCSRDRNTSDNCEELTTRNFRANAEKEDENFASCTCDHHKVGEIIREIASLKERNQSMEAELSDMQERYSEMSLKFAEVEGERQQLVKTIRTLKNALKN